MAVENSRRLVVDVAVGAQDVDGGFVRGIGGSKFQLPVTHLQRSSDWVEQMSVDDVADLWWQRFEPRRSSHFAGSEIRDSFQ